MNVKPMQPIKREWMKKLRKEKKLTIKGIAPLLDISWQHYSDIENGRRNPSMDLSYQMSQFFGINIEQFFQERTKFESMREND